jgi:Ca2+-binding EF-hand superfamily protein
MLGSLPRQDSGTTLLQSIFEDKEGHTLKAWIRHFDVNGDAKITFSEFCLGMKKMGYAHDVVALFNSIDLDGSGELSLEEIDARSASLWSRFRQWCVKTFPTSRDMLLQLTGGGQTLDRSGFTQGCKRCGWTGQFEELVFESLDSENLGFVTLGNLKWFDADVKRLKRKDAAKARSGKELAKKQKEMLKIHQTFHQFKVFLKTKYGSFLRAWLAALDMDSSMSVPKAELFKACSEMNWTGDVRALWRAMDKDDSGVTSLEELDINSAAQLASFKHFIDKKFGDSHNAFKAFDRFNSKKLKQAEFIGMCKGHGFTGKFTKWLFQGIDHTGRKFITEHDMQFLDRWKPPLYLTCQPNAEAADAFKNQLMRIYDSSLKGWTQCLDRDSSNRVNWQEFEAAAKKIRFNGDVAGAWRFLDLDMSGFISLHELDPDASNTLLGFKRWADDEFGGVRSAFTVIDSDGSNEITLKEFKRACRSYGFEGNCKRLFDCFDSDNQGLLTLNEISFLDEWDVALDDMPEIPHTAMQDSMDDGSRSRAGEILELTKYGTVGPGPAAYELPEAMGAAPSLPMVHHSGCFSFAKKRRPSDPFVNIKKEAAIPSSVEYEVQHAVARLVPRKPHWLFPMQQRRSNSHKHQPSKSPGPGAYMSHGEISDDGPQWSLVPRRTRKVHPRDPYCGFLRPLTAR